MAKFIDKGGDSSYKSTVVIHGVEKELECKKGVIVTNDPALIDMLSHHAGYEMAEETVKEEKKPADKKAK